MAMEDIGYRSLLYHCSERHMGRIAALLIVAMPAWAANEFAARLLPVLEKAQCRMCHNDNGVASTTRLQFPREGAAPAEIERFGARLRRFVDAANPEQSLLFRKPTNRVAHAGGERIKQGSSDEQALKSWVEHLASLPESAGGGAETNLGPARKTLRRLTHSQYNHTVRDLLGDETRPADQFPKEDFVHGFTNQAEGQSLSPLLAEAYAKAAERVARAAFRGGDSRKLIPCEPTPECRARFVREFGRRAFRRPLEPRESARYETLFARESDLTKGAELVIQAMLQSPHFLFHTQTGGYGVANRLSYFLWDTMPDETLFRAAARGDLDTAQGIEKQVRRMLDDDRAKDALDEFLAQWIRFDRLRNAIRDRRLFPEFTNELVSAMTEETLRLFRSLVWHDGNFLEFFTARYSFLTPELARLYGVPEPKDLWARVEFGPDSERAGIFGQGTFLALTSKPADTSPTERGLFIREHFLCQGVPPPPPGVNATLPPVTDERPMSNRERLQIHLSNAACAGCHTLVDPIGFGFEKFDAIGKYREKQKITLYPTFDEMKTKRKSKPTEHLVDLDTGGSVRGLKESEFHSPRELADRLARETVCQKCVVKQLFRYANGRTEQAEDQPAIDRAFERFRNSRFRFRELIIAIALGESAGTLRASGPGVLAKPESRNPQAHARGSEPGVLASGRR